MSQKFSSDVLKRNLDTSLAEVKQLSSPMDGAVTESAIGHQLWKNRGLCARHNWLYAVVESDLRYRPFQCTILYEDLIKRAAQLVETRIKPNKFMLHALGLTAPCYTCEYLKIAHPDQRLQKSTVTVNQREKISEIVSWARPEWEPRSCPECLGGHGPPCRSHLLGASKTPNNQIRRALEDTVTRLGNYLQSMT